MSFAAYPQPDACRALMPTPEPHPPGPPSRPMVCHMPKGHDGLHSIDRRPGTLSRRWEGDARPAPLLSELADLRDRAERAEAEKRKAIADELDMWADGMEQRWFFALYSRSRRAYARQLRGRAAALRDVP